ncbi:negative regulator of the PHO system [Pseudohyphozyma bogoriensis]|nr:negative regulator of the PHO system [Pseudohyphozyma bogoriensis]
MSQSDYLIIKKLGEGAYSTVYQGYDQHTQTVVALKKLILDSEHTVPSVALREISLLQLLKQHPNIIDLLQVIHTDNSIYMVFEYLDMDLRAYIDVARKAAGVDRGLSMSRVKLIMWQLFKGVAFCHEKKIWHRDLKPQNVLINRDGQLKIGDFGLASMGGVGVNVFTGGLVATLWYRAPEVLLGATSHGPEIDTWSLGVIMVELITSKPAFKGCDDASQLITIYKVIGTPSIEQLQMLAMRYTESRAKINVSPRPEYKKIPWTVALRKFIDKNSYEDIRATDLIDRLLLFDGAQRPSAASVLMDEWFSGTSSASVDSKLRNWE